MKSRCLSWLTMSPIYRDELGLGLFVLCFLCETETRIMTKSVPEYAKKKSSGRCSKSVNKRLQTSCKLLRNVRRQLGTRGSHEGTGSKPMVPDKSTVVSTTSSEGTSAKPGVLDEDKDITEEKVVLE
ncbi:hypothetical protein Tco_0038932 [Tanacetum coccineum]